MWRAYVWNHGHLVRIEGETKEALRCNFLSWAATTREFKTAFPHETEEGHYVLSDEWHRAPDDWDRFMPIGRDNDLRGYIEDRRSFMTCV